MDELKIPNHVAIIMDGNGRWATNRGLKRSEGHKEGSKTLEKVAIHAINKGVKVLSVYAFSTDNFKRTKEEVDYLMNLFILMFKTKFKVIDKENIKVIFSGRRKSPLPKKVITMMEKMEIETKNNTGGILNICINYGGHSEIIDATKKIIDDVKKEKVDINDLDEAMFSKYLYQDLAPIDLLIRTSGENRISNFMLWQLSYSEFYFPKTYFPDFDEKQFDLALLEYNRRDRRFGGIKNEEKNN